MPKNYQPVNPNVSPRGLLREQAYVELKKLIRQGEFAKMPFVSERKLARLLGMSNTPVRSAVEKLETEGLLFISPQQGIVVRELSADEIADHFELRQALEGLVVRKLAGKLQAEQTAQLRANIAAYEASLVACDTEQFVACDGEFHLLLAEYSGNLDVHRVLRQLRERLFHVVQRVIEHTPDRMRFSVDEHRQIVDLLDAGDSQAASIAMLQHLQSGLKILLPNRQSENTAIA